MSEEQMEFTRRWHALPFVLFVLSLLFPGCATLNGSVPFRYVSSLPSGEASTLRLGMEKLVDARPGEDRDSTESISDVDEKVTSKLLEDFRASRMFAEVDFPASKTKDAFILKGEIKRFSWDASTEPIMFIPIFNLMVYFGVPVYDLTGIATLHVQLVDTKTDQVVGDYEKTSERKTTASIYNMKAGEAGAELADAFREVAKKLKDAIGADIHNGKLKDSS